MMVLMDVAVRSERVLPWRENWSAGRSLTSAITTRYAVFFSVDEEKKRTM